MGKRVEFTMRIDQDVYAFICSVAKRRRKTNADVIRELLQKEFERLTERRDTLIKQ